MVRRSPNPRKLLRRGVLLLAFFWLGALLPVSPGTRPLAPQQKRVAVEPMWHGGAGTVLIDSLHPEAFRTPAWIDVEIPSNWVTLRNLRVLTAHRSWTLQICESVSEPETCTLIVGSGNPRVLGWRGDFRDPAWSVAYEDRDRQKKLHLMVTPAGGDWMIFRIQLEATLLP